MLKVSAANPVPTPKSLWFPGTTMEGFAVAPPSKRALEIAKSREELLGLLRGLPEHEFELSLTDLVEKAPAGGPSDAAAEDCNASSASDEDKSHLKKKMKKAHTSSGSSRRRLRSRSDGVLLRFYVPASLTRSHTAPRPTRGTSLIATADDYDEREETSIGCWSSLWIRRVKSSKKPARKTSAE